ncbi:MAG TPA: cupin domain-containing protein [Povalibacter sp.]|nr:cupin domain-containing protein [Povalibacter sp.]
MFLSSRASAAASLAILVIAASAPFTVLGAQAPVRGAHHFHLKKDSAKQTNAANLQAGSPTVDSTVPLTGDMTEGAFTLQDEVWDPKFNVPLHFHKRHAEVFYIVDGEVEWTVGGETHVVGPGELVYIPPNTPHKVRVVGGKPMHTLFMFTPGGYEDQSEIMRQFSKQELDTPVAKAFAQKLGDFNQLPDDTAVPSVAAGAAPHRGLQHFALRDKTRTAVNSSGNVSSRIVLSGDDSEGRFTIQDETWPADFNVRLHHHKRHWEVFYLLGGSIEWTVGGETHVMQTGDVVYVPANTPHKVHVVGGKPAHILFVQGAGGYEATVDLANAYPKQELERPAAKAAMDTLHDFHAQEDPNPYKPPK